MEGITSSSGRMLDSIVNYDTVAEAADSLENVRTALLERETSLQRWAVSLEMEVRLDLPRHSPFRF